MKRKRARGMIVYFDLIMRLLKSQTIYFCRRTKNQAFSIWCKTRYWLVQVIQANWQNVSRSFIGCMPTGLDRMTVSRGVFTSKPVSAIRNDEKAVIPARYCPIINPTYFISKSIKHQFDQDQIGAVDAFHWANAAEEPAWNIDMAAVTAWSCDRRQNSAKELTGPN